MGRCPHEDGPLKGIRERTSRERAAKAAEKVQELRAAIAAIPDTLGHVRLTSDAKDRIRKRVAIGIRNQRWWGK